MHKKNKWGAKPCKDWLQREGEEEKVLKEQYNLTSWCDTLKRTAPVCCVLARYSNILVALMGLREIKTEPIRAQQRKQCTEQRAHVIVFSSPRFATEKDKKQPPDKTQPNYTRTRSEMWVKEPKRSSRNAAQGRNGEQTRRFIQFRSRQEEIASC